MAGSCAECGTYHYEGPPCENCGEMAFAPAPKVMKCADCGEIHRDASPPCDNCGTMGFQRVKNPGQYVDGVSRSASSETPGDDVDLSEYAVETSSSPSRRTVLYGAGVVAVLGIGGYTFLTGDDYPSTTAPGHAEEVSGIQFEAVETRLQRNINDERENEGTSALTSAENVNAFTTYYNKQYVKNGGGELEAVESGSFDGKFNVSEYHAVSNHFGEDTSGVAIDSFGSATELARDCFESWMDSPDLRNALVSPEYSRIGTDVHVDDHGDVFLMVVVD